MYCYDQLLKQQPQDYVLMLQKGDYLMDNGMFEKAKKCYRQTDSLAAQNDIVEIREEAWKRIHTALELQKEGDTMKFLERATSNTFIDFSTLESLQDEWRVIRLTPEDITNNISSSSDDKIAGLEREIINLKEQAKSHNNHSATYTSSHNKISNLETEVKELKEQVKSHSTTYTSSHNKMSNLETEVKELKGKLNSSSSPLVVRGGGGGGGGGGTIDLHSMESTVSRLQERDILLTAEVKQLSKDLQEQLNYKSKTEALEILIKDVVEDMQGNLADFVAGPEYTDEPR